MFKRLIRWGLLIVLCYSSTLLFLIRVREQTDDTIADRSLLNIQFDAIRSNFQAHPSASRRNNRRRRRRAVAARKNNNQQEQQEQSSHVAQNVSSQLLKQDVTPRVYECQTSQGELVEIPRVPDFIIGGTQKGGTTALLSLIKKHPLIVGSTSFESHFFDYDERVKSLLSAGSLNQLSVTLTPEQICDLRVAYAHTHFDHEQLLQNTHFLSFEKTPAYILNEDIPARIKAITPWVKIIFSLRNPIDRAFSHFQMMHVREQIPVSESFESVLATDLKVLQKRNFSITDEHNLPFPTVARLNPRRWRYLWKQKNMLYRGMYADQLRPWLEHFTVGQDLMVVQFERMIHEPHAVLDEILDFLGVHRHTYDASHFNKSYSPVIGEHSEGGVRIRDETREYLLNFYEPYNAELADMLGSQWENIWNSTWY